MYYTICIYKITKKVKAFISFFMYIEKSITMQSSELQKYNNIFKVCSKIIKKLESFGLQFVFYVKSKFFCGKESGFPKIFASNQSISYMKNNLII